MTQSPPQGPTLITRLPWAPDFNICIWGTRTLRPGHEPFSIRLGRDRDRPSDGVGDLWKQVAADVG